MRQPLPRRTAWALLLLLGGCAIGPDYQRPADLPVTPEYHNILTPQQAQSFADLDWVRTFEDPELVELIREAIEGNLDLSTALLRVEEARGFRRSTRGQLGPQLGVEGSTSPSAAGREDSVYSLGLALSWELDLFGRLRRADEAARAELLGAEYNARAVLSTLVADVASTWFELRELDEELEIIDRTIASQTESLALVESQNRAGVASGAEVQQALGQLATTRAQKPAAEQRRAQVENRLRFLLGYPPDRIARTQSPLDRPPPPELPVGLPAQLLERRPDLGVLEARLHAATARIGVAEATRFPYLSIGLTSFLGILSPELGRLLDADDPAAEVFSVGPYVNMPLFTSGVASGNVDVARAQARQAELAYRRGVLQSLREVSDALIAQVKLREFIEQSEIRESASRETLRLQRLRYLGGVVSYLEVLDAERQLFAAEIDLSRAKRDLLLAYVELYRSLGGGWSETEIERLLARAR
jgi:multidrug efflux system outer membrane protein